MFPVTEPSPNTPRHAGLPVYIKVRITAREIIAYAGIPCQRNIARGSCQVVTEFLSGDHLNQRLHCTNGFTEQVNTVNLSKGVTFMFKKTPVVFDVKHLV